MPAWWSRRSSKNNHNKEQSPSPTRNRTATAAIHGLYKASSREKSDSKSKKTEPNRPRSFDEVYVGRNSPRESRDLIVNGAGSSGFLGFDSDSSGLKGHPLPTPSVSSILSDHGAGLASGSGSVSSVSSSGSSEDHHVIGSDQGQFVGGYSESGQMCAIKEVRVVSDDQSSKESLKQLNQEINLLSQLSHPNIVRYYGSELAEETLSVYLEYVSGGSIYKLLQEYGPFKEPVIQTYTRQILSGLAYLHARNTVHRDIKGANILVDPHGEIKLADFGMAKHITACSSMLSFKGSPYWMAPEVVMNTNGYSLTVDIWSLGCTILEMATSKPPWNQYEGVAAIFKIGNSKDIPEIPDHLSSDAKSFIRQCLQRDPSARPTAAQLLDHPFVRDPTSARASNNNLAKDSFPFAFDGSRTPPMLDLHPIPTRKSITLCDADFVLNPLVTTSRAVNNPRENIRMITSLPVSPSSSPLRQHGPAHKSCFLSPPHPTYATAGPSSYSIGDYTGYRVRSNPKYISDPWLESSLLKAQTPGASPRTRPI
ncbi:mitogen-activated protein kinase kinase kinase 3 isoform X2 [Mangifera indica]|uniref:mitogen-activated protein kinase kinase kinase 3 isoform X2 n=1 Tax=Mangifera indica TaxID=29780 RepID=UPI001CFC4538|nr:mitogen-activated protein kinase kinase kinase 3 isoform X2 [Mangifera indica]